MKTKYSKYILWSGTAITISIFGFRIFEIYQKGALFSELHFKLLALLLVCSPYIYMLLKSKAQVGKSNIVNHLLFSALISLPSVSLLFVLIYVAPDAQNGIFIFIIVIFQWLACGVFEIIGHYINRDRNKIKT